MSAERFRIHTGDSRDVLQNMYANSVDCIFTSPDPIRSRTQYNITASILGELCKRVLKPTGSMWVNMEDAYNEEGSLMRWPARFSNEMVHNFYWTLRAERIWHLPVGGQGFYNGGKVIDNNRLILDHSYVFHFTMARYGYYNTFEGFGGQPCSIFTERPGPTFSTELIKQSLLMSCPQGGTVMDPFCGTGVTGAVALAMKDKQYYFIGIDKDEAKTPLAVEELSKIV